MVIRGVQSTDIREIRTSSCRVGFSVERFGSIVCMGSRPGPLSVEDVAVEGVRPDGPMRRPTRRLSEALSSCTRVPSLRVYRRAVPSGRCAWAPTAVFASVRDPGRCSVHVTFLSLSPSIHLRNNLSCSSSKLANCISGCRICN